VCLIVGPLSRYKEQPIEQTCAGCEKRDTKPGSQPMWLVGPISDVILLDEVKACGGTFPYPDGLTPRQWASLRALERARAKDTDKQNKLLTSRSSSASETDRLKARVGQK
jgi:hypothetical protein